MENTDIIHQLQLKPHPEGGFYKETYRCEQTTSAANGAVRNLSTAIYYMLEGDDRSHFHRIKSDELWFFHQGSAMEIICIQNGELVTYELGNSLDKGEVPQVVIPANCWFAAHIREGRGYSLVSCTVAPGFDFDDFEMGGREELVLQFPHLTEIIKKFTRF